MVAGQSPATIILNSTGQSFGLDWRDLIRGWIMVVEWLRFRVLPGARDRFLAADAAIWTPFLESCAGFVRKEVWCDRELADEVVILVYWQRYELWKAIAPEDLKRVEQAFEAAVGAETSLLLEVRCFEPWGLSLP